ncbi:hypothetical protein GCM10009551_046810 [Nocardiopsis tropica]
MRDRDGGWARASHRFLRCCRAEEARGRRPVRHGRAEGEELPRERGRAGSSGRGEGPTRPMLMTRTRASNPVRRDYRGVSGSGHGVNAEGPARVVSHGDGPSATAARRRPEED